jgi:hypothetical protein
MNMYFASILVLLLMFPLASIAAEAIRFGHSFTDMGLIGKWFVFWAVGVRLFLAGVRQVLQPSFTAVEIFDIHEPKALAIVRELGFANLSMGLLGLCGLWHKEWLIPAAIVAGSYYGLAGLGHVPQPHKNAKEYAAMISDGFAFLVLVAFVISVA